MPGPLVPSLLVGDGRCAGVLEGNWIEHFDALDVVVVPGKGACSTTVLRASSATWPLDPCTPVAHILAPPDAVEPLDVDWTEWGRAGATLTAALQLGLADRLGELAVAYAKERVQFDRPIGSFQAIKHLLADMVVRTEVARASVYTAGAHLDAAGSIPAVDRAISGAKFLAGEAAIANGKAATQVYGGMGFTWEIDVHLYLKRAWVLDTHFGSADEHSMHVGATLGSNA